MITTNYDLLLEDAFAVEFKKAAPAFTYKNTPEVQQFLQSHKPWIDRPVIFKIHGTIASPSETILGELDYRKLLRRRQRREKA